MNFKEALEYLDNLTVFGIKTGLNHTKTIAKELNNPQKSFPPILIGGTNGKGSTAAYIESILRQSGYKTGLFTSPHLVDIRERIRINGKVVSKEKFSKAVEKVKKVFEKLESKSILDESPTFFEVLTLAAFLIFNEEKIDIAVVEVGMGGGKDCTNILDPLISVVTNVSFDHEKYLGRTLKEIAEEKSGIFRKGKIAVVGKTSLKTLNYLKENAVRVKAKFEYLDKYKIFKNKNGYTLKHSEKEIHFPFPPLLGEHQIFNSALSVLVSEKLNEFGFNITKMAIQNGIKKCRWEGRLQKILINPDTYLDGAHNIDGIKKVRDFAKELKGKKILLFSALKDKPVNKMIKILEPHFDTVIITLLKMKRGAQKEDFGKIIESKKFLLMEDIEEALFKARKLAGKKGNVIVCGSLYLVGEILSKAKKHKKTLWGTGL